MKKIASIFCLSLMLGACATGYRKLGWADTGYEETQIDFNNWLVTYHGSDVEYCKQAGLYRAAQIATQLGFAYFRVKSEQVRSTFLARTRNPIGDSRESPEYMVENSSGLEKKYDVAGYSYRVELLKTRSSAIGTFDAAELLKRGIPGESDSGKKIGDGDGK